jgi:hypothetical protein
MSCLAIDCSCVRHLVLAKQTTTQQKRYNKYWILLSCERADKTLPAYQDAVQPWRDDDRSPVAASNSSRIGSPHMQGLDSTLGGTTYRSTFEQAVMPGVLLASPQSEGHTPETPAKYHRETALNRVSGLTSIRTPIPRNSRDHDGPEEPEEPEGTSRSVT